MNNWCSGTFLKLFWYNHNLKSGWHYQGKSRCSWCSYGTLVTAVQDNLFKWVIWINNVEPFLHFFLTNCLVSLLNLIILVNYFWIHRLCQTHWTYYFWIHSCGYCHLGLEWQEESSREVPLGWLPALHKSEVVRTGGEAGKPVSLHKSKHLTRMVPFLGFMSIQKLPRRSWTKSWS